MRRGVRYMYIPDAVLIDWGVYIVGRAGESVLGISAVVALDHGGEEGVWTRRAKGGRGNAESYCYAISKTLPEQRGHLCKVGVDLTQRVILWP